MLITKADALAYLEYGDDIEEVTHHEWHHVFNDVDTFSERPIYYDGLAQSFMHDNYEYVHLVVFDNRGYVDSDIYFKLISIHELINLLNHA